MKKLLILTLAALMMFSLLACGGNGNEESQPKEIKQLDMKVAYQTLEGAVQLPAMLTLDESLMLDYCGISSEKVKQAVVAICEDSLRTDEIWLLEAVSEDAAKDLMDAANNRLKKKGEESITYSPEQYAVVQKAQLLQFEKYVVLFVSPDAEALANAFRQELGI